MSKCLSWSAAVVCITASCWAPVSGHPLPVSAPAKSDILLFTMQRELDRATTELKKLDPAPYFISYSVYDQTTALAVAGQGSLMNSTHAQRRTADVIVRVGAPALDNTHEENRSSAISSAVLPLNDDPDAIARVLWRLTYTEYRKAARASLNFKTKTQVNAK